MGEMYPETKVIYHIDDEETPYMIRLPVGSDRVCLGDFKIALKHPNCKFFFKSMDDDFGVVKEEIIDDNARLPCINGKVVSWLVTAEGSGHSDSNSHCTETANKGGADHRPPSFHGTNRMISPEGNVNIDQSACTSETESTISGLPKFPRHGSKLDRRQYRRQYEVRRQIPMHRGGMEISSALTSDLDTTSVYESEDGRGSRVSSSTDITSVSRMVARQKRKRRRQKPAISRTSSFSSITESSMSLNVITVTLNMDTVNFLGISIVGHSNTGGDGGIYVGSIMKGGAVALDGRIEPGDMILQVNEVSFENMNNDDAVRVLRESVQRPGPIKLVVAKNWDPQPKGYFTIPRTEPVRPIDPGAWVAHTNAMRQEMLLADFPCRPSSAATYVTNTGESMGSSIPETEKYLDEMIKLDVNANDMATICAAMARPDSGLEVRERMWLKISIPNAFIGAEVVDWLYTNVQGFSDRREARKYAARLLKEGFIRHTVNKITFSEQCYYVFGDLCSNFSTLRLSHSGAKQPSDSAAQSDCGETVAPLPPPGPTPPTPTPWGAPYPPSFASSYNPLPLSGFRPTFNSQIAGSTGSDPFGTLNSAGNLPPTARSEANSNGSGGSGGSSGSEQRRRGPLVGTLPKPPGNQLSAGNSSIVPPPRGLSAVPTDLTTSKQSFALAMNNPHEFFVDVM